MQGEGQAQQAVTAMTLRRLKAMSITLMGYYEKRLTETV